jgi:hypothetical protein
MLSTASGVHDVTAGWDDILGARRDAWPYQSTRWGRTVAEVFGGTFRVLRLDGPPRCFVPILVGGSLAAEGFCCGHIGYGGVLPADGHHPLSAAEQTVALMRVEDLLGVRCQRLVVPPDGLAGDHPWPRRETSLVPLANDENELWRSYAGSVRTAVRKCRLLGLRTAALAAEDTPAATTLIRQTQAEVGAEYRVPAALIERITAADRDLAISIGCWLDQTLLAVGVFLRAGGRGAYLFNGWRRDHGPLSPNYLMLHEALRWCASLGDRVMDLGYSHNGGLREFKQRWGARPAAVHMVSLPTSRTGVPRATSDPGRA